MPHGALSVAYPKTTARSGSGLFDYSRQEDIPKELLEKETNLPDLKDTPESTEQPRDGASGGGGSTLCILSHLWDGLVKAVLAGWAVKAVVRKNRGIVIGEFEGAERDNGEAFTTGHIAREVGVREVQKPHVVEQCSPRRLCGCGKEQRRNDEQL